MMTAEHAPLPQETGKEADFGDGDSVQRPMMALEHAPLEQLASEWDDAGAPSQSLEQQN
jgi:hypothetical protein